MSAEAESDLASGLGAAEALSSAETTANERAARPSDPTPSSDGRANPPAASAPTAAEKRAALRAKLERIRLRIRNELARYDPCDDPDAEPIGLVPLLVLVAAIIWSLSFYWRYKFQPMQDVGHHVGLSAVVADWGRAGSLYTELYEFPNPLNANSLLYTVAGYLGKLVGVTFAFRLCMSFYIAGIPLANLYALRVFGRSSWGALIAVPLVYFNMNYVAGFANLLFAGPFLVLSVPLLYRLLDRFSWKRLGAAALCYACVFLSHAHVFLWAGFLGAVLTLVMFVMRLALPSRTRATAIDAGDAQVRVVEAPHVRRRREAGRRLLAAFKLAGASLLAVTPSLLLFWRWYDWAFGAGKAEGAVVVTSGLDKNFGAAFKPAQALWHDFPMYSLKVFISDEDLSLVWKLGLLVGVSVALARLSRLRKPPVLEIAFLLTLASYFVMPESIDTNPVVGSRQTGIALWFLPGMINLVAPSVSRIARYVVIAGMLWFVDAFFVVWRAHLVTFEHTEAAGLEYVLEAAPPRQHLHLVKIASDWSKVFGWRPVWHVEKYYMADKFGQVPDNPAIVSTSSIRYRKDVDPHRIGRHSPEWSTWDDLWKYHELILVHGWKPTASELEAAKAHGRRVRQSGDWELWRRHGDWETGDPNSN